MATTDSRPTLVKGSRALRSTISLKIMMAVSGLVFIAFVLGHMYGNLKAFAGQESFNGYAEHLRAIGEPLLPYSGALWILRLGLIAALVVHVASAVTLWRRASKARPQDYRSAVPQLRDLLAHDALGRPDDPGLPGLAPPELLDLPGQPRDRATGGAAGTRTRCSSTPSACGG